MHDLENTMTWPFHLRLDRWATASCPGAAKVCVRSARVGRPHRGAQSLQRLVLALLAMLVNLTPCAAQTWSTYNGHEYTLTSSYMDLPTARRWAARQGGYLAAINDAAEQVWVQSTFGPTVSFGVTAWIGFSDEASEGDFIWDSGEPVLYTHWEPGQPDNGGGTEEQDWTAILLPTGGWWDGPVWWGQPALVERPSAPQLVNIPPTFPTSCGSSLPPGAGTGYQHGLPRVLITEVRFGSDVCIEVTSFSASTLPLAGWTLSWWDPAGGAVTSAPLSISLENGESVVAYESSSAPPPVPPSAATAGVLPPLSASVSTAATVALRDATGKVVDEVHVASSSGSHSGFSFSNGADGGFFRGLALRVNGEAGVERIWGLDSDGGSDWTAQATHSLGLQSTSSGTRGYDPIPVPPVLINEVSLFGPVATGGSSQRAGAYVEFVGLEGAPSTTFWVVAMKFQGEPATLHRPWDPAAYGVPGIFTCQIEGQVSPWNPTIPRPHVVCLGYNVVSFPSPPPPEMPFGTPYSTASNWLKVASSVSGIESFLARPFECVLYDAFGRVADVMRSTRLATSQESTLVHNEPRLPAPWGDFTGAAPYWGSPSPFMPLTLARASSTSDSNRGTDWRVALTRTMGTATNSVFGPVGHGDRIDVRLHDGIEGPTSPHGLTFILNAGPARAGSLFSLLFSFGHADGFGPLWGLGADALNYWLTIGTSFPFSGLLGPNGEARFDFPPGSLPPGIPLDCMFILQDPVTGALLARTMVVTYDS